MKLRLLAGASAFMLAAGLTACGSSDQSGEGDGTLTVWLMRDSVSVGYQEEFEKGFEAAHPDIDAEIQIQEWEGITEKVTAALASNDAPDVIEVGNTQVAMYASSGGVTDLSDKVDELGGEDWLPGLAEPGAYEGKQYGIPFYAANRVIIYRTDLFDEADIDPAAIKTRDQWIKATTRLNSGGDQGIYLPGQGWYVLAGFIWDEGGALAVESGGEWKGTLDTPEALRGMEFYQQLQALGKGPKDSDGAEPPLADVMAKGNVAQIIASPGIAKLVVEANPELEGKLGFLPVPGKTADAPGAVYTGGSNLIVPVASSSPDAAYTFIKELTSEKWQKKLTEAMSYLPNKSTLADDVSDDPGVVAMAAGASANGHAAPNTAGWAAVEAANPINDYMTAVLIGGDPETEASKASSAITEAINGASS